MNNHIPALLAGILILSSASASQAAEFPQGRPDQQTLSELPTIDWLTNGGNYEAAATAAIDDAAGHGFITAGISSTETSQH